MNGRAGLAAWQWLFIFDGIIGIPIALYGYWAIPGKSLVSNRARKLTPLADAPTNSQAKWLKPDEKEMAINRMRDCKRAPPKGLTWRVILGVFKQWPVYLFSMTFICHVVAIKIYSYFNVYLKATKRFSVEQINLIPTGGYGLQIVFTLSYAWTSDALGMRWPVICFACCVAMIGTIILSVWPSGNIHAMLAGWLLTFCETGAGALIMSWINEVCSFSAEYRVIVIAITETMAFVFQAWLPLFIYNTGQSPHFKIGYEMATTFFAIELLLTLVMWQLQKRLPIGPKVAEKDAGQMNDVDPA